MSLTMSLMVTNFMLSISTGYLGRDLGSGTEFSQFLRTLLFSFYVSKKEMVSHSLIAAGAMGA